MPLSSAPRRDRVRRETRPAVEGMESRKLLSAVAAGADVSADVLLIKHGWHDADAVALPGSDGDRPAATARGGLPGTNIIVII